MPDGARPFSSVDPTEHLDPKLLLWLSPAFPVGAFAYSHGLEWAAERGWIGNRATLESWLADLFQYGSARNDLIVLAAAWRAHRGDQLGEVARINELALAMQPSSERNLEAVTQGNAFLQTISSAWPFPSFPALRAALHGDAAYPVAVGAVAAGHDIACLPTLVGYGLAFATNLTSAAIRLGIIGQTDGQRVIAALMPSIYDAAKSSAASKLDDLGSATLRSDIASLAHETQYSRLFRS